MQLIIMLIDDLIIIIVPKVAWSFILSWYAIMNKVMCVIKCSPGRKAAAQTQLSLLGQP